MQAQMQEENARTEYEHSQHLDGSPHKYHRVLRQKARGQVPNAKAGADAGTVAGATTNKRANDSG